MGYLISTCSFKNIRYGCYMRNNRENIKDSEGTSEGRKISRRVLLFGGAAAVVGGGWWGLSTYRPYVGKDNTIRVPYTAVHRDATPVATSDAGQAVYQPPADLEGDKMPVLDDYTLYAPEPANEVHAPACEADANKVTSDIPANLPAFGWHIPSLGVSSSMTSSGVQNGRMVLPITTDGSGIWYSPSNPISATEGSTILAGHVNKQNYYLSPWGYLHRLKGCERVFVTDGAGKVTQWHVTEMYTVPQSDLTKVNEMWQKTGSRSLWLVTCAGSQVGNDGASAYGNTFGFGYQYNLVVKCEPCV